MRRREISREDEEITAPPQETPDVEPRLPPQEEAPPPEREERRVERSRFVSRDIRYEEGGEFHPATVEKEEALKRAREAEEAEVEGAPPQKEMPREDVEVRRPTSRDIRLEEPDGGLEPDRGREEQGYPDDRGRDDGGPREDRGAWRRDDGPRDMGPRHDFGRRDEGPRSYGPRDDGPRSYGRDGPRDDGPRGGFGRRDDGPPRDSGRREGWGKR